jgi:hypothetical protein
MRTILGSASEVSWLEAVFKVKLSLRIPQKYGAAPVGGFFYVCFGPTRHCFRKAQIPRRRNIDQLHYMSYLLAVDDSWEHGKT